MKTQSGNCLHWAKAIALVAGLMCTQLAFATDTVDIPELQTQASAVMSIIQFVAKWGGILCIVGGVITIGMGKAKGEMGMWMASLAIMVGGLGAAWGWFTASFTHGFVW